MADPADGDFLSRWSRRKQGEHPEQVPDDATVPVPEPLEAEPTDEGDPEVIADLPDIDRMDDASDFSVFLKAGVPEALRRRALRKLWRINPVLANLDGLNDYDEDYTMMSALGEGMKTLYKVGKGFATDDSEEEVSEEEVAESESPPDDSEHQSPSKLPTTSEPEPRIIAQSEKPDRDELTVKFTRKVKGTANRRRWGQSETPSSETPS